MYKRLSIAVSATWLAATVSYAASPLPVDPAAYPALNSKQMGHIRAIVHFAGLPDSDWSGMGSAEPGQGGFDSYRYQLAMMSYTLSLAHHRYTPAFRELYKETDARLIHKMMLFDVWGFWELTSRGAKGFDPSLIALREGWVDPVVDENIMYSGHLFQMVTTHEMLYNDDRYTRPGALTFVYDPVARGMGRQEFKYDTHALAKVLASQFEDNGWKGIECEPNAIFPECNQHPLLGFSLYDQKHGTDYFTRISKAYKEQFDALNYIDPKTASFMNFYLIKQDKVIPGSAAWSDGWSGAFMHGWHKFEVERVYPIQKENFLTMLSDGTATTHTKSDNPFYSHDHGFLALLAAEVGDTDTRDRMLAYADTYWAPRWKDGALFYPRQDAFKREGDGPDVWRRVQPLTGNGLLGLARMNSKDGIFNLFNSPFKAKHFEQPYLTGIAYPDIFVERAVYDANAKALVATLSPRRCTGQSLHWRVAQLDPSKSYEVWIDREVVATFGKDEIPKSKGGANIGITMTGDTLTFVRPITKRIDLIVAEIR